MLINSLGLKNFKCFETLDVKFAPITLLTGANSSGKSSLINAILAVLQTEQFPFYLSPNGKYVNMGSFDEMVFGRLEDSPIHISVKFEEPYKQDDQSNPEYLEFNTFWKFNILNNLSKLQKLEARADDWFVTITRNNNYDIYIKSNSIYIFGHEEFIKSVVEARHGSFSIIEAKNENTHNLVRISNISVDTIKEVRDFIYDIIDFRFVDNFLSIVRFETYFNYLGSFRLPPERTYNQKAKADIKISVSGEGYIDQIIEWEETDTEKLTELNRIMHEIEIFAEIQSNKLRGGRFELSVKPQHSSTFTPLTDVGFGISQFLPIIVADLQLSNHSCLAVSQPEIHLHPKIQATFGNYMMNQIKKTNKQYIIETHSEYLLNRIRLLLVTGELKPEDVRVLYFENDGVKSTVHDVEFCPDGQIKGAPAGFFDTYGIDVMNIAMNAIG